MYKIVTCHFCNERFDIDTSKGEPYAPVCRRCTSEMNKRIRSQQERKR